MRNGIVFLLGAGASKEAGLPLTDELFHLLEKDFETDIDRSPDEVKQRIELERALLFFVREKMRAANSVFTDPNSFEDVITTIEELGFRFRNRLFPFVDAWNEGLIRFEDRLNSNIDEVFHAADQKNIEWLRTIAKQLHREPNGFVFQQLMFRIRKGLRKWLHINPQQRSTDYLAKLREFDGPIDVFTLNYDLTIETALSNAGARFTTGFIETMKPAPFTSEDKPLGVWDINTALKENPEALRLYKLHGSLSWFHSRLNEDQQEIVELPPSRWSELAEKEFQSFQHLADWNRIDPPTMIFGIEHKLVGHEPYLSLFSIFAQRVRSAECLVVIGCRWVNEKIVSNIIRRELLRRQDPLALIEVTKSDAESTQNILTAGAKDALESGALNATISEVKKTRQNFERIKQTLSGSGLRYWQ